MSNNDSNSKNERRYDSVMTVREMMDYLNISRTYAYELLERNEIPYIKFGRTYRILKEDLDRFCKKKRKRN